MVTMEIRISLQSTAAENTVVDFTTSREATAVKLRPSGACGKYAHNRDFAKRLWM